MITQILTGLNLMDYHINNQNQAFMNEKLDRNVGRVRGSGNGPVLFFSFYISFIN